MKIKTIGRVLTTLSAIALLSGCVIVTDRDDWDDDWDGDNKTSWQHEQDNNREAIAGLNLGESVAVIRERLGKPEYSEAFTRDGHQYLVLRYRTHHRHSDGETTQDETTPLVFEDELLVGWGESVLANMF
jgi:hypothetical protein